MGKKETDTNQTADTPKVIIKSGTEKIIQYLQIFGGLSIFLIAFVWLLVALTMNSYFNSFFIDFSKISSIDSVWFFAIQHLLGLLKTALILLVTAISLTYILLNENVKIKGHFIPACLTVIFTITMALSSFVIMFFIQTDAGRFLAKIDQEAFDEGMFPPMSIEMKDSTQNKTCVALLSNLSTYTIIIEQDRSVKLINQKNITSINTMVREGTGNTLNDAKSPFEAACPNFSKTDKFPTPNVEHSTLASLWWYFIKWIFV